uniref:Uncharacterized protein n=1 Tax=Arundo donax TaxID=35708 RepID=A0A0A9B8D6_ARUDO
METNNLIIECSSNRTCCIWMTQRYKMSVLGETINNRQNN